MPVKVPRIVILFNGDQRRSAGLRVVLENDLFQDAAGVGKVCRMKRTCRHLAVALVRQLFCDLVKPKGPEERQQSDTNQHPDQARTAQPL